MASPSVVSRTLYQGPSSDASTASVISGVDLSGGNFAVALVVSDGAPNLSVNAGSTSGWSKVDQFSSAALCTIGVFKKANPTSSETLVIDSDASEQFVGQVYLVDDATNIAAAGSSGSSGVCNPPSLDIGSSQDVLWLAVRAPNAGNSLSAAGPTGYGNLSNRTGASTANTSACIQVADKQSTGQTEDPGNFGSTTNPWCGATVGIWKVGGAGAQAVTPSLFSNPQTFFGATVSANNAVSPSLATNSASFFGLTVTSSYSIAPPLVANAQSFFVPSVSMGAALVVPPIVTNIQSFFGPSVAPGAVALTPSIVTNTQSFFSASVQPGPVALIPGLITNSQAFFSPIVSQGGGATQSLALSLLINAQEFYGPTATPGAVSVAPGLLPNVSQVFALAVEPGAVSVAAPLVGQITTFFAPSVTAANDVFPPLLQSGTEIFEPTLSLIGLVAAPVPLSRTAFVGAIDTVVESDAVEGQYRVSRIQRSISARGRRW